MNGLDSILVLKVAFIGGLLGFVVFCASYSIAVWRKRNKGRSRLLARLSFLTLMLGAGGGLGTWGYNELSERSGVLGGNDLFVIRSKREANIQYLAAAGSVTEGKVLVEFIPPGIEAQLTSLDSQIKEAEARLQALELSPLALDTTLLHEQSQLQAQINQMKNVKPELQKARRDIEKDINYYQMAWTREKSQIETEAAIAKQSLASSSERIKIATDAYARAQDLRRNNNISAQGLEERNSTLLALGFEKNKALADIGMLEKRLTDLDARYGQTRGTLETHFAAVDGELAYGDQVLQELEASQAKIAGLLAADRERATATLSHEKEAAHHQLSSLVAERDRIHAISQEKAPFTGTVVYRHPSPGLAPENVPILAFSTENGFNARIMMSEAEAEEVSEAGSVKFSLKHPVLTKFFVGSFTRAEAAPFEPGTVIAHFDVQLPTEAITLLAQSAEPVRVRLHWQPELLSSAPFQGSMGLLGLGMIGMIGSAMRRRPDGQPEIRSNASSYVAIPMSSGPGSAVLVDADQQSHRLAALASSFHLLLRQGVLTPDIVLSMQALIDEFGEAAVQAVRGELIFDQELCAAIDGWNERNPDHGLGRIIAHVNDFETVTAA